MESERLVAPRLGTTLKMVWRAALLRCPRCGSRGILKGWFDLQERCPKCALRLERGEQADYFSGGMMMNIIFAELIFAAALAAVLIITWPDVPWDFLEYGLAAGMVLAPILLYPVSRVVWLALDLAVRPRSDADSVDEPQASSGGKPAP